MQKKIKKITSLFKSSLVRLYQEIDFLVNLNKLSSHDPSLFIITSKDVYAGTKENDIANPLLVTEIATELIITRLYLIDLLNSKKIDPSVTIVCADERKYLYTELFHQVISYKDFLKLKIPKKRVLDLLSSGFFNKLAGGKVEKRLIPYLPFYQNWDRDKNEILKIKATSFPHLDLTTPFIALVIRSRGAWPEKNMSEKFWSELLDIFRAKSMRVFVFGRETEVYCDGTNIIHVSTFHEWCTVVKSPNLKHVGSTMTGAVYPVLIFGTKSTEVTLIDNLDLMDSHGNDPSFYHPCINFSGCSVRFLNYVPTPGEFFNVLTKNL